MVVEALQYRAFARNLYDLDAFVVMPNHVHLVCHPKIDMSRILQWLKGTTAKRAIRLLNLSVPAFWQDESYDHRIRSEGEMQRIIRYVEENSVRAGQVETPEQCPWSSATQPQTARPSAPPQNLRTPVWE